MTYALGRNVQHDPRSRNYVAAGAPTIKSQKWERRVPIFDQGGVGSCTGMAAAGLLATDSKAGPGWTTGSGAPDGLPLDVNFAENLYASNTQLDNIKGTWPPDDTGSTGLAAAKTLVDYGYADVYHHAFSIGALAAALQYGPVMIGIPWYNSMFETSLSGRIYVDTTSGLAGGHELVVDQMSHEIGDYWVQNSWGSTWGTGGRGWLPAQDLKLLLSHQGDVTVPHLIRKAAEPKPEPAPPKPIDQKVWDAYKLLSEWAMENGVT